MERHYLSNKDTATTHREWGTYNFFCRYLKWRAVCSGMFVPVFTCKARAYVWDVSHFWWYKLFRELL